MKKQVAKSLSTFHLISIISLLTVLGAFLLIMSGLFDEADITAQQQVSYNNDHVHDNSVDLNKINEINRLEEIVKSNPGNHEALLNLGHLLNDNRFYDRAIEKYNQYLSTHPDNADVIVDMGVCYFELKKYDQAITTIKSALKVNPKHQIAHFNLGIVNLANNNVEQAKEWWQKARDIDPKTNVGIKSEELLKSNN